MKLLVIADDFTGANDTGVQLAKKGAKVEVSLQWQAPFDSKADVVVINTESRALPVAEAKARVQTALSHYQFAADTLFYKKVDSTLRGNLGAEIEAMLQSTGKRLALVAPAIPVAGRITKNGICYVNGVPLLDTEFASDPKTPICSSVIKEILAQQTDLPVVEMNLEQVNQANLAQLIQQATANLTQAIVVLDAQSDRELSKIAQSLAQLTDYILVGAAGLANALPETLYTYCEKNLPVLVVAGSMSEVTRKQVHLVKREGIAQVVDVDIAQLLQRPNQAYCQQLVAQACQLLNQGHHCVLRSSKSDDDRHQIEQLCQQLAISRQALGEMISQQMGELTQQIVQHSRIGGLFLTGGDIAIAVAQALHATGYRIQAEVAPCIPCGTLLNSDVDDLPVITKAGGFGHETTLKDSLYFIETLYQ